MLHVPARRRSLASILRFSSYTAAHTPELLVLVASVSDVGHVSTPRGFRFVTCLSPEGQHPFHAFTRRWCQLFIPRKVRRRQAITYIPRPLRINASRYKFGSCSWRPSTPRRGKHHTSLIVFRFVFLHNSISVPLQWLLALQSPRWTWAFYSTLQRPIGPLTSAMNADSATHCVET